MVADRAPTDDPPQDVFEIATRRGDALAPPLRVTGTA
jgi:hypothetical protein